MNYVKNSISVNSNIVEVEIEFPSTDFANKFIRRFNSSNAVLSFDSITSLLWRVRFDISNSNRFLAELVYMNSLWNNIEKEENIVAIIENYWSV